MNVQLLPPKAPPPPAPLPVGVNAVDPFRGFDSWDFLPGWAYQMVPVGGVRYLKISNWWGSSVEVVDNPACLAIAENPRVAASFGLRGSDRLIAIQGRAPGSALLRFANGPLLPAFELQVRVKPLLQIDALFHFVTDAKGRIESAFSPARLAQWLVDANRVVEPQANLRFVSRGVRYLDLLPSQSLGGEVLVAKNPPAPGDEGARFVPYCEQRLVNVFFVWNLISLKANGQRNVEGTVPFGPVWWRRPAFVGAVTPYVGRLIAHEMCHVLGASDLDNGQYLMNTNYPGTVVDFNTNDCVNPNF